LKDADNNGYDYFSFTTQLAENADDWDGIANYRFGAVSEGDFLVTDELLGQELSLENGGDAYKVVKGKYILTLDYANMKLVIEKAPIPDVYVIGEIGDNEWAANLGQKMDYNEETGLYTAEIESKDADNSGYDYFQFTTRLGNNADDWDNVDPYCLGPTVHETLVTDDLLGQELSLIVSINMFKVVKGKYNLTLNYDNKTVIIEKVADFLQGDVNGDGEVDVRDITALIDVIMNSITDNPRADVNQDGDIDVRDITALIDIIMNS